MSLDVVFMGTPQFSVVLLEAIIAAGHRIVAVYAQPPRPAGRGMATVPSPVEVAARGHGLRVETPKTLRTPEAQASFRTHGADVGVVVAYGLILPKPVLDAPRFGCLNMHASKLPRWRGAAPIQRAIMAGDTETAATVMRMDEGLDTGPICLEDPVPIGPDTTAGELHDILAARGAALMVRALAALESRSLAETVQPADGVTYAAKIDKRETRIDFQRAAGDVHNHVRGLSPFPGAWLEISAGGKTERVKVLRSALASGGGTPGTVLDQRLTIACGDGAVRLVTLQRAGKKPVSAEEFLRGFPVAAGAILPGV